MFHPLNREFWSGLRSLVGPSKDAANVVETYINILGPCRYGIIPIDVVQSIGSWLQFLQVHQCCHRRKRVHTVRKEWTAAAISTQWTWQWDGARNAYSNICSGKYKVYNAAVCEILRDHSQFIQWEQQVLQPPNEIWLHISTTAPVASWDKSKSFIKERIYFLFLSLYLINFPALCQTFLFSTVDFHSSGAAQCLVPKIQLWMLQPSGCSSSMGPCSSSMGHCPQDHHI